MPTVRLVDPQGETRDVDVDAAAGAIEQGWRVPTDADQAARLSAQAKEVDYGGVGGAVKAGLAGAARGATLGLSDVAARALGGEDTGIELQGLREAHPIVSAGSEIVGAIAPAFVTGGASLPASVAGSAGRGAAAAVGGGLRGAIVGGAAEGAIYGAGQGLSELALSDDPLTLEHAASTLSSNMLFGGLTGAAAGGVARGVESGLARAKGAIDSAIARKTMIDVAPDIAAMDTKGLKAAATAERDTLEAARAPDRLQLVENLHDYRDRLHDADLLKTTWGVAEGDVRELGGSLKRADREMRNLLDRKALLAERPERAIGVLQQQEQAMVAIERWGQGEAKAFKRQVASLPDTIRAELTAPGGSRVKGEIGPFTPSGLDLAVERELARRLEAIAPQTKRFETITGTFPIAIEHNRELQRRIGELTAAPTSERLSQIATATEQLAAPAPPKTLAQHILGAVPFAGPMAAIAGASGKAIGGLRKAAGAAALRAGQVASSFLGAASKGAAKAAPYAPVLATKVLAAVRYAPGTPEQGHVVKSTSLARLYRERTDEIKSQTAYDAGGVPRMRPDARAAIADRLHPIRASDPILADRIETAAARRLEYLSSLIPRRPEIGGVQIGPDRWQPSDLEMRGFARSAAAVEDPLGVLERAVHGAVTPEDADAMRAVHPEILAEFTGQVSSQLPSLRHSLPIERQTSLSLLTGIPVNPAMDPAILSTLQAQYQYEPEQAQRAQPQFGSVKNREEVGTPAQRREEGSA